MNIIVVFKCKGIGLHEFLYHKTDKEIDELITEIMNNVSSS